MLRVLCSVKHCWLGGWLCQLLCHLWVCETGSSGCHVMIKWIALLAKERRTDQTILCITANTACMTDGQQQGRAPSSWQGSCTFGQLPSGLGLVVLGGFLRYDLHQVFPQLISLSGLQAPAVL